MVIEYTRSVIVGRALLGTRRCRLRDRSQQWAGAGVDQELRQLPNWPVIRCARNDRDHGDYARSGHLPDSAAHCLGAGAGSLTLASGRIAVYDGGVAPRAVQIP